MREQAEDILKLFINIDDIDYNLISNIVDAMLYFSENKNNINEY